MTTNIVWNITQINFPKKSDKKNHFDKNTCDTKSRIRVIPNLSTDADRSTDTKRKLFWMYGWTYISTDIPGGGGGHCHAQALKPSLKLCTYTNVTENIKIFDFDQFMVILKSFDFDQFMVI